MITTRCKFLLLTNGKAISDKDADFFGGPGSFGLKINGTLCDFAYENGGTAGVLDFNPLTRIFSYFQSPKDDRVCSRCLYEFPCIHSAKNLASTSKIDAVFFELELPGYEDNILSTGCVDEEFEGYYFN